MDGWCVRISYGSGREKREVTVFSRGQGYKIVIRKSR